MNPQGGIIIGNKNPNTEKENEWQCFQYPEKSLHMLSGNVKRWKVKMSPDV